MLTACKNHTDQRKTWKNKPDLVFEIKEIDLVGRCHTAVP